LPCFPFPFAGEHHRSGADKRRYKIPTASVSEIPTHVGGFVTASKGRTNIMNDRDLPSADPPLSNDELLAWIEFACWTMLALWPLLY
jgi:hypothetical protein